MTSIIRTNCVFHKKIYILGHSCSFFKKKTVDFLYIDENKKNSMTDWFDLFADFIFKL